MKIGIVNDMRAACEALRRVVNSLPDHEVAWTAVDGVEAIAMAKRDRPDLILMDLIMPHIDGVQATRQIMTVAPCAILVVTATVSGNISLVYDAMGFGALDAVDTPNLGPTGEVSGAGSLVEKIGIIAKLVGSTSESRKPSRAAAFAAPPRLMVVGASTGGPKAVSDLLLPLPHDWNAAVVIVQHVDVAFSQGLAKWLSDRTNRAVRVAEHGQQPVAGDVLLAGTNDHLVMSKARSLEYREEPKDVFFRPSVDVFFESVAEHWPQTGMAIVLTGMGKDGARGLLKLRSRGWHTIAQNEATSVVWSMPKAAIEAGAACEVLAIDQMPRVITTRLSIER
ncbi:MAG: chemotaxis-specific protein-glutamate methyltransferase CheB [Planctomycetia bacterium]|nr:chemotaxis-specific protein-glutamate methyltransferase CheB [Planctomycetia bacterium]